MFDDEHLSMSAINSICPDITFEFVTTLYLLYPVVIFPPNVDYFLSALNLTQSPIPDKTIKTQLLQRCPAWVLI